MRIVTIGITFLTALSLVFSTTHRVPQDFATIQAAINAAAVGDTVLVDEGTYAENIVLKKNLFVTSRFHLDADTAHILRTIIDGGLPRHSDSMSVVTIDGTTDTTLVLNGFTITNGRGNRRYAGILSLWFRLGTAIDLFRGGARIINNVIRGNNRNLSTERINGTISVWNSENTSGVSFAIIENNTISDNALIGTTAEGGALAIGHSARVRFNVIMRNSVAGSSSSLAGGISIWNGSCLVANNRVMNNSASHYAGGISVYGAVVGSVTFSPTIRMENNLVAGNSAGRSGGGIYMEDERATLYAVNNTIANNSCSYQGAGIFVSTATIATAKIFGLNNIFWNPGPLNNEIHGVDVGYFDHSLVRGESMLGSDIFSNNPQFVPDGTYRLSDASPCIAAGVTSQNVHGSPLTAPATDLFGTMRARPAQSAPDIGAIESDVGENQTVRSNRVEMRQFEFGGITRNYAVIRPKGIEDGTNQGVLMFLHSYGSAANEELNYFQLYRVGDSLGFLTVYPEAYQRIWNSGINANPVWPAPSVDDVGFISALIDSLRVQYGIDTNRVYAAGYSNGAFMTYRLAAQLGHRIRSVVAVCGTTTSSIVSGYSAQRQIPLLILNGTADGTVPYAGGQPGWYSTAATLDFWRLKNGADSLKSTYYFPDINTGDGSQARRHIYMNAAGSSMIWFYYIVNGNHNWPGTFSYPGGKRNLDIDMNNEIYNFITDKSTSVNDERVAAPMVFALLQNYPNPFNPSTTIRYALPHSAQVKLAVYDLLGREIETLVDDEQTTGWKEVQWDASGFASGMYLARMAAGSFVETKKILLMK